MPARNVWEGETHGVVPGTQGMGVSTPRAAAVAAATSGVARLMHMPKVGMFISGALAEMLAAGLSSTST